MHCERKSQRIAWDEAFLGMTLRTLSLLACTCALFACGRERLTVGYTSSPRSAGASEAGPTASRADRTAPESGAGRAAAASDGGVAAGCEEGCRTSAQDCGSSCNDPTRSEAGSGGESGTCEGALRDEVTSDVVGHSEDPVGLQYAPVKYFAGGASLAPGRYRVEYVDGCFTCCVTLLDAFVLVGGDRTARVAVLPGGVTTGLGVPPVAQCPAAGAPFPPLDFDFAGGPLGIWVSDGVAADNTNGDGQGGRSPTWRLTRLDACPDEQH
jgi:hypothetical protein